MVAGQRTSWRDVPFSNSRGRHGTYGLAFSIGTGTLRRDVEGRRQRGDSMDFILCLRTARLSRYMGASLSRAHTRLSRRRCLTRLPTLKTPRNDTRGTHSLQTAHSAPAARERRAAAGRRAHLRHWAAHTMAHVCALPWQNGGGSICRHLKRYTTRLQRTRGCPVAALRTSLHAVSCQRVTLTRGVFGRTITRHLCFPEHSGDIHRLTNIRHSTWTLHMTRYFSTVYGAVSCLRPCLNNAFCRLTFFLPPRRQCYAELRHGARLVLSSPTSTAHAACAGGAGIVCGDAASILRRSSAAPCVLLRCGRTRTKRTTCPNKRRAPYRTYDWF